MAEISDEGTDALLIASIITFFKEECNKIDISDDKKESLEVAIQCLQTAYDLKPEDIEVLKIGAPSLRELFSVADCDTLAEFNIPEDAGDAEKYKIIGNDLMKVDKNAEAVDAYTQAISICGSNAVYYCNRAAAYSRLGDYSAAIKDCEEAISLNPGYGKAYGRMGFAYSSHGDNRKAIECYKKAIELDPLNESYRTNLKLAEESVNKEGNIDSSMRQDPNIGMQGPNMGRQGPNIGNIMSSMMSASANESGNVRGIESLFNVGLQLFQQIQTSNPELIEQLQEQLSSGIQRFQNDSGDREAPK